MVVDCHVHTRDFRQANKETIEHALNVAKKNGIAGIFAMPNTDPTLDTEERVREYLNIGDRARVPEVFFGVYMALTGDTEQVKRAVDVHHRLFPKVVGFKLYAGHSTGNIGVVEQYKQIQIFETLKKSDYRGVLAVHCEKEQHMNNKLFIKDEPITHATLARPEIAEVESVGDMIYFSEHIGFKGKLHIAHISSPKAVEIVNNARIYRQLNISCGVCPHHLIFDYNIMKEPNGILYKMNPPLREPGVPEELFKQLREGKINWIESDHAPHRLREDKLGENPKGECASGVPALHAWPLIIEWLKMKGVERNQKQDIHDITHGNIVDRFGIPIVSREIRNIYNPKEYGFNIWSPLEVQLGWPKA